jgi:mRNA-degrading endonuclease toxin of MazEF toxin-antitoxin module
MPEDCVLSLDNIAVVPRAFFRERITRLGAPRLSDVCSALAIAAGCA